MEDNNTQSQESLTNDEKLKAVETQLADQRAKWGERLITLIKTINNLENLQESQVTMLSYRQMIVDQMAMINIRLRKVKSTYERNYKTKLLEYYNHDYKMSDKHKDAAVVADLHFLKKQISFLETQIEYYSESVRTLDQMAWAIKNRINIESI
jgi:hypothetical protein